ncbi:hypothetical protein P3X46_003078 [Hevea brasiliensis]|uniref:Gnk2-homologous domain-containing protein n=1 Tax=Hevea brasiliensis TaxID=3981 RepID=A0ABQ9N5Z6_HEVBR|nr:antifungal protein ginkbilobin-like protein [Hevea brasiliensis]KAJ9187649.1 hypothetical protein P3X46_003078 [Hevea brasiliensis]
MKNQSKTKESKRNREMGLPSKLATTIILAFFGFLLCSVTVTSVPNTVVQTVLCNTVVYSKGDPFGISLSYVVEELQTVTPTSKNYDYYNISPYPNAFAYGHAACNQNLTSSDCATCLDAAKTTMFSACQSRIGARSVLQDCTIRYEQYPFSD